MAIRRRESDDAVLVRRRRRRRRRRTRRPRRAWRGARVSPTRRPPPLPLLFLLLLPPTPMIPPLPPPSRRCHRRRSRRTGWRWQQEEGKTTATTTATATARRRRRLPRRRSSRRGPPKRVRRGRTRIPSSPSSSSSSSCQRRRFLRWRGPSCCCVSVCIEKRSRCLLVYCVLWILWIVRMEVMVRPMHGSTPPTTTRHPNQKSWAHHTHTPHTATQRPHGPNASQPHDVVQTSFKNHAPPARLVVSHPPICDIWSHNPPSPSRRTSFGNSYTAPQHQVYTLTTTQLSSLDSTSQSRVSHSSLLCCPHAPTSSHSPLHLTNIHFSLCESFGRFIICCVST